MMSWVTNYVATLFSHQADFSQVRRLIDVGGGNGESAIILARKWGALRITIFDLPSVCSAARVQVTSAHLDDRIDTFAGDCFVEEFPADGDGVLFNHFLEIWSQERILHLLEKAYRVLPHQGQIFLVNLIQADDQTGPAEAAYTSAYFHALASGEGMVYTFNEYERWLREAGFRVCERKKLTKLHGFVKGIKE